MGSIEVNGEVAKFDGCLVIGDGTGIRSVSGVPAPRDCVPTPRMVGEDMHLGPRQQPYNFAECALHLPEYRAAMERHEPTLYGPRCGCCDKRGMMRLPTDMRLYQCPRTGETFVMRFGALAGIYMERLDEANVLDCARRASA